MSGIKTRFSDVLINILIFRENLEDLYAGDEEFLSDKNTSRSSVISKAHFTEVECYRIARYAFNTAVKGGRRRMTIVHKANIIKQGHGMFLEIAQEVARDYPSIVCDNLIADNCMMQLVQSPERFDCLLAPNLFGDLLSDLCAGLIGGLGFAPGANIGEDVAIFEAVHGTAPDIAGKGLANPTSLILSAAMMLDHLDEREAANRVRAAVDAVLLEGTHVTADAKRAKHVGAGEYVDAVIRALHITEPA
jgi:isocitrate dehydrogenase (NAD+)